MQNENHRGKKNISKHTLKFPSHKILFREGDIAESLYVINSGMIRLFSTKGKGQVEIAVLHSGEVFGEMALFSKEGKRRTCSAETIVSTELVEITFDSFNRMCKGVEDPWLHAIIKTMVSRLTEANVSVL